MGTYHGKATEFTIDGNDLSAFVTDVEGPAFEVDVAETTAKASAAKTYVEGHEGSTFTISGRWDDTATTGPDDVLHGIKGGGEKPFEIGLGGLGTSGDVEYTGNAILTSYTPSSPLADVVTFTADFQVSGLVTRSVVV